MDYLTNPLVHQCRMKILESFSIIVSNFQHYVFMYIHNGKKLKDLNSMPTVRVFYTFSMYF